MKLKAKSKNRSIEIVTDNVKLINFFYYFLRIFRFEITLIDWSDEDVE